MKKYFMVLIILISANTMFAQENFPMSAGLFVSIKGGVNAADVPKGVKNGFAFNSMPDIGANFYLPLAEKNRIGLTLDLAYTSYFFQMKYTGDEDNPWVTQSNYFTLSPALDLYGFIIGFNFGLPLSISSDKDFVDKNLDKDNLNFATEIKLGGLIPVFYNETGRLNIIIMAGYFLTGQYDKTDNIPGLRDGFNTHPASLSFGLNYMFNVEK